MSLTLEKDINVFSTNENIQKSFTELSSNQNFFKNIIAYTSKLIGTNTVSTKTNIIVKLRNKQSVAYF